MGATFIWQVRYASLPYTGMPHMGNNLGAEQVYG